MKRFAAVITITLGTVTFTGCEIDRPVGPSTTLASGTGINRFDASAIERVTTGGADITFLVDELEEKWSFEAKRAPGGAFAATGEFQVNARLNGVLVTAHGDIVCFQKDENRAYLGGMITHGVLAGETVVWSVEDNGEGNRGTSDKATSLVEGFNVEPSAHCMIPVVQPHLVVEKGNVQVHPHADP